MFQFLRNKDGEGEGAVVLGGEGKGKGKAKRDLICLYFTVRTKNHTKRVFLLLFRDRVDTKHDLPLLYPYHSDIESDKRITYL